MKDDDSDGRKQHQSIGIAAQVANEKKRRNAEKEEEKQTVCGL